MLTPQQIRELQKIPPIELRKMFASMNEIAKMYQKLQVTGQLKIIAKKQKIIILKNTVEARKFTKILKKNKKFPLEVISKNEAIKQKLIEGG